MDNMNLSADVRRTMQAKLAAEEAEFAKNRTKKMTVNDFETLTIIGRGAFGEVRRIGKLQRECYVVFDH